MAYAFVNQLDYSVIAASGATSISTSGSGGPTATLSLTKGNKAMVTVLGVGTATSFSDNLGNIYRSIQSVFLTSQSQYVTQFWADVTVGGTATFTASGASNLYAIYVGQYSGLASGAPQGAATYSSGYANGAGTGANVLATGNITPPLQPGMLWAFAYLDLNGALSAPTAGTYPNSFTGRTTVWGTFGVLGASALPEDVRLTATASTMATAGINSTGSTNGVAIVGVFFPEVALIAWVDDPWDSEWEDREGVWSSVESYLQSDNPPPPLTVDDGWDWSDDNGVSDAEDGNFVLFVAVDSAPVGLAQPPLQPQGEELQLSWWEEYEDPLVEDSQWSGPIQPNAPPRPVEDTQGHDLDDADDSWENWAHDNQPVGLAQPSLSVGDDWDWTESNDYSDEPPDDDGSNVRTLNQPARPVEDSWEWVDDDGQWALVESYLQSDFFPPVPPEDGWDYQLEEAPLDFLPDHFMQTEFSTPITVEDGWDWTDPVDTWLLVESYAQANLVVAPTTPLSDDGWDHQSDEAPLDFFVDFFLQTEFPSKPLVEDGWDWIDPVDTWVLVESYSNSNNVILPTIPLVEDGWDHNSPDDAGEENWETWEADSGPVGPDNLNPPIPPIPPIPPPACLPPATKPAGWGGDKWGASGGSAVPVNAYIPLAKALSDTKKPANAIDVTQDRSTLAKMSDGSLSADANACTVPNNPRAGSS